MKITISATNMHRIIWSSLNPLECLSLKAACSWMQFKEGGGWPHLCGRGWLWNLPSLYPLQSTESYSCFQHVLLPQNLLSTVYTRNSSQMVSGWQKVQHVCNRFRMLHKILWITHNLVDYNKHTVAFMAFEFELWLQNTIHFLFLWALNYHQSVWFYTERVTWLRTPWTHRK